MGEGCSWQKNFLRSDPLTQSSTLTHPLALSLEGRGHNNNHLGWTAIDCDGVNAHVLVT